MAAAARIGIAASLTKWPLQGWIRSWPHFRDIEKRYLDAMEARGVLSAHRRRVLGLVPRTSWRVVSPGDARHSAAVIAEAVQTVVYGPAPVRRHRAPSLWSPWSGPPALPRAYIRVPSMRGIRSRIEQITEGHPIGAAVSAVRESDRRARKAD
ncbi:GPP34 family phosphoprotein [Streptomyces sp. NPDC051217]|uniref:GPP34 family phosphoprotein n=1 Tax=Streptomyces sp. NPDC051217 TaxID=3365644 RepID=UPI0037A37E46